MQSAMRITILLVEDHPMVREAHIRLLAGAFPEASFFERDSVAAAIGSRSTFGPLSLIVLNVDLAGGARLAGFRAIQNEYPGVPVILVDGPENAHQAVESLDAGAFGFLPKRMRGECILQAVGLVLAGERYVPSIALAGTHARQPLVFQKGVGAEARGPIASLSPRRRQILSMVAGGAPNKVIARALDVHEVTVKSHLRAIFKVLGVNTRTQAARLAMYADMAEGGGVNGDPIPGGAVVH
jgi:two-component system, NarL family, nitrate/nitrite response regulator NarL